MTARPIRYQRQVSDRKGKIFYTSITSLSHISKHAARPTQSWHSDTDGKTHDLSGRIKSGQQPKLLAGKLYFFTVHLTGSISKRSVPIVSCLSVRGQV